MAFLAPPPSVQLVQSMGRPGMAGADATLGACIDHRSPQLLFLPGLHHLEGGPPNLVGCLSWSLVADVELVRTRGVRLISPRQVVSLNVALAFRLTMNLPKSNLRKSFYVKSLQFSHFT